MWKGRSPVLPVILLLLAKTTWGGVSGRVISSDAKPIGAATVSAYAQETAESRAERLMAGRSRAPLGTVGSTADGSFQLDTINPVVDVEVRAEGFAPSFVTVVNGQPLTAALTRAKSRRGVVTAKGKPITGATVVWMAGGGSSGASTELIVKSGADGSYDVPDPDVWANGLVIIHPDFGLLERSPDLAKWPPSLAHELDDGVAIEGSVVEERSGQAVAGARLWVGGWPLGKTAAGGAFLIGHAPSAWRSVLARTDGLVGTAKPAGRLVIQARPARALSGVVRDAKTREPIAGAMVALQSLPWEALWTAASDARGRYTFPSLAAAQYRSYVLHPGYSPDTGERD